ncbi:hypothetical protein APHAL10511_003565 [Amanita phalloides]|nr:hypothetical protein APHAL10511_003565 [Amanita phalloides]
MTNIDFVSTTVNYGVSPVDASTRAYQALNADPITGQRDRNWTLQSHEIQVENLRGREDTVSLDTAGFRFYTSPSKYKGSFLDDEEIRREYYPESEELIKQLTGATKVVFFDHTVRRNQPGVVDNPSARQPSIQVHVDQTPTSSIARVHRHLSTSSSSSSSPSEAQELLKRRFQIINLWRPIVVPALDFPLALCDYRSVDPKNDLFPVALVCPDREGETFVVKYNPDHKWKYVRGMTPDDVVLLKCFDSVQDGNVAVFTPHTAFPDPTTPEDAPRRKSIELRALVFYE